MRKLLVHTLVMVSAFWGCAPAVSSGPAASTPERLQLEEIADPGLLGSALLGVPFLTAGTDTGLIAVRYDSVGALREMRFSHPAANEGQSREVESVFRSHVAEAGPASASAWFTIVRGPRPRVELFRPMRESAPQLRNRVHISRLLEDLAQRPGFRSRQLTARLLLGLDGKVIESRVEVGSGSSEVDLALLEVARQAQFTPARLDRFPVAVWIQLPLSIQERNPRRQ